MDKKLFWLDKVKEFSRKIYQSGLWKRTRLAVLALNPYCVICKENGRLVRAVDVDHTKQLSVIMTENHEQAYDMDNLRGLCKKCHGEKSYTEGWGKGKTKKEPKPKGTIIVNNIVT